MGTYNYAVINLLIDKVNNIDKSANKSTVISYLKDTFNLVKDRSVYTCAEFSVRICASKNRSFSNTILSLSTLFKYDDKPFIVVLDTPYGCSMYLANSTFLKKISHSSHELRIDNIKGSFNGSDIIKNYDGIDNVPHNFEKLFSIHQAFTKEENIERLVEATNNIVANKQKYIVGLNAKSIIFDAPNRALNFLNSEFYEQLYTDLYARTLRVEDAIVIAALIDNVNLRGRLIEELITSDDPLIIDAIKKNLYDGEMVSLKTDQKLGDYSKSFDGYITETDIKTKVLFLHSAPKAYNIDKFLEYLSTPESVYLFYLIGIDSNNKIKTKLVSAFDSEMMGATKVQFHWAGRNSRGVTQLDGYKLNEIINSELKTGNINIDDAKNYLEYLISL